MTESTAAFDRRSLTRRTALTALATACVAASAATAPALASQPRTPGPRRNTRPARQRHSREKYDVLTPPSEPFAPEAPHGVSADTRLAAYALNSSETGDYGNYSLAARTDADISSIIIHDTEVDYDTTLSIFQNPLKYASIHYVVREDGHITQMVRGHDIAWHAGNWTFNQSSIGIELIGVAEDPSHYTDAQYAATGALVRYLCDTWDIPRDRDHVLAHEDLPGGTAQGQAAMHWDPGAYYDWAQLQRETGMRAPQPTRKRLKDTVTIAPRYDSHTLAFLSCNEGEGRLPARSTSHLWVRTEPHDDAPLITDPALAAHSESGGTERICDWGDQVAYGQTFAVAEDRKDWVAIWISGRLGWIRRTDANGRPTVARGPKKSRLVTTAGDTTVDVFGSAYPSKGAFERAGVEVPDVAPLPYEFEPGQRYVVEASIQGSYYQSPGFEGDGGTWVRDTTEWLRIQLNHRSAFVRAADVTDIDS